MASNLDSWVKVKETRKRLEKCWDIDIDWSLYPGALKEVSYIKYIILNVALR